MYASSHFKPGANSTKTIPGWNERYVIEYWIRVLLLIFILNYLAVNSGNVMESISSKVHVSTDGTDIQHNNECCNINILSQQFSKCKLANWSVRS